MKIQKFWNRNTKFIPNGPLVPVRKQPGLKAGAFSPALLVLVAITGTNGLYKPGLKALAGVGPHCSLQGHAEVYGEHNDGRVLVYGGMFSVSFCF
jgi:hypothetical protein